MASIIVQGSNLQQHKIRPTACLHWPTGVRSGSAIAMQLQEEVDSSKINYFAATITHIWFGLGRLAVLVGHQQILNMVVGLIRIFTSGCWLCSHVHEFKPIDSIVSYIFLIFIFIKKKMYSTREAPVNTGFRESQYT